MLERESGISPERITARGYWTETEPDVLIALGFSPFQCRREMGPFLVIPEWTTAGVQVGYKIKADHPRTDPKSGKPIKYESPHGASLHIDAPPGTAHHRKDPSIPVFITEGVKKADSAASRGLYCLSLNGVYGFMRNKRVVDDFDDLDLHGREVRLALDGDVTTNPKVADAMRRLAGAANRRGAKVSVVHLAELNLGKGLDDVIVAGATPDDLDAVTRPWVSDESIGCEDAPELERLRTENVQLRRITSAQAELLRNPTLKDKPRMVGFATITEAAAMASRGEVDPDGYVHLDVARIVNDYRPRPAKGEAIPETNPQDGSLPLTSRNNAKTALTLLIDHHAIDARFAVTKRKAASGDWYADTELVVKVTDMPAAIIQLASFDGRKARKTYTRQAECPSCGEVHARSVRTFHASTCMGCGTTITTEEPTRIIPVPVAQDPGATEEQRETLRERDVPAPMVATEKSASTKNR
ncbi:MAG: DUF3854 domain-containing protein, partial [Thermomicrobiales bacterium]